jgi:GTP-binding protein
MDSMDLEREKGITIKAKNTSVHWNGHIINIVDTPGHADFGGEVERVMKMVDGVLLVVDAYEGPQAQTRFVLKKALQQGLKPIVSSTRWTARNSEPEGARQGARAPPRTRSHRGAVQRPLHLRQRPRRLGAAPPDGEQKDMTLLRAILEHIPAPFAEPEGSFEMLVSNIDWDNYVGRVAIGKILAAA